MTLLFYYIIVYFFDIVSINFRSHIIKHIFSPLFSNLFHFFFMDQGIFNFISKIYIITTLV